MSTIVKRSDKKHFYGIPAEGAVTFTRMKHFTELSASKNPKEYARQYVDEPNETTDIVGYSPSLSFAFDEFKDDAVLTDIVDIIDKEKLGTDARREFVQVDFSSPSGAGFKAVKRTFSVIADSEGGSFDAYTYSGSFKAVGKATYGVATITTPVDGNSDNVETITFAEENPGE